MKSDKDKRALKKYLRKSTLGDFPRCFLYVFYVSALGLPSLLASSPPPLVSFSMALPYIIAFGILFYLRRKTSAYLAKTNASGELERLIDDFLNAQPVLADRLRIGDEWLFGQGARRPVRIADISSLRHKAGNELFQGSVYITLLSTGKETRLCRYPFDKSSESVIGGLVCYLLEMNPGIATNQSLLELATHDAGRAFANKMAARPIHGTWGTCSWEIDDENRLTVRTGTGASCRGKSPWTEWAGQIASARFESRVVLPPDCSGLFAGCTSLAEVNDGSWDMSNVTTMRRMFCGCSSLEDLPGASAWNVSHVLDMTCAFDGCSSLQRVFTANWDTSSVRDMTGVFWGCSSLEHLGIANWITSQVEDMRDMFLGCTSLVKVNLTKWDISKVKSMNSMFKDCISLTELDLSLWNPEQLEDAYAMVDGCSNLDSLAAPQRLITLLKDNGKTADVNEMA